MRSTYYLLKHLALSKSFNPQEAICLFADPRSGSTWLAEILSGASDVCLVDEPLSLTNNHALAELGFSWRQSIPQNAIWPEAKLHFENLLSGNIMLPGSYAANSLGVLYNANRAVFKIIRGKLLLHWLLKQIDFHHAPIFLLRHPLAVIFSMQDHPSWQYPFKPFQLPESPFDEIYLEHKSFFSSLVTSKEQLLAYWCLGNQSLWLEGEFSKNVRVIKYEDLVIDPEDQFRQLFNHLGMQVPIDLDKRIVRPSASSTNRLPKKKEDLLHGWKKNIVGDELLRYNEILKYFKIDLNYFNQ